MKVNIKKYFPKWLSTLLLGVSIVTISTFLYPYTVSQSIFLKSLFAEAIENLLVQGFFIGISICVFILEIRSSNLQTDTTVNIEDTIFSKIIQGIQGTYFIASLLLLKYCFSSLLSIKQYFADVPNSVIYYVIVLAIIQIFKGLKLINDTINELLKSHKNEYKDNEDGVEVEHTTEQVD